MNTKDANLNSRCVDLVGLDQRSCRRAREAKSKIAFAEAEVRVSPESVTGQSDFRHGRLNSAIGRRGAGRVEPGHDGKKRSGFQANPIGIRFNATLTVRT